jgi:hypothetical protein
MERKIIMKIESRPVSLSATPVAKYPCPHKYLKFVKAGFTAFTNFMM